MMLTISVWRLNREHGGRIGDFDQIETPDVFKDSNLKKYIKYVMKAYKCKKAIISTDENEYIVNTRAAAVLLDRKEILTFLEKRQELGDFRQYDDYSFVDFALVFKLEPDLELEKKADEILSATNVTIDKYRCSYLQ